MTTESEQLQSEGREIGLRTQCVLSEGDLEPFLSGIFRALNGDEWFMAVSNGGCRYMRLRNYHSNQLHFSSNLLNSASQTDRNGNWLIDWSFGFVYKSSIMQREKWRSHQFNDCQIHFIFLFSVKVKLWLASSSSSSYTSMFLQRVVLSRRFDRLFRPKTFKGFD